MMKSSLNTAFNRRLASNTAKLILAGLPIIVTASPGHNHSDAALITGVSSLPRFSAVSEEFELVGVLDGKKITVFLDRAQTNEAVKQANIDLELGGTKVKLNANAEGAFVAQLAAPLKEGVIGVVATVIVGQEIDLLAGELDLHLNAHASDATSLKFSKWHIAGTALGGLAIIALLLASFRRARSRRNQSKYLGGTI